MNKANAAKLSDSISVCVAEGDRAAREFLTRIGDKWSILVVAMLSKAPGRRSRFMGLKNSVEGISQTMLTATLRNLERDGMVVREIFPEVPPRVEYELTTLGLSMLEPMQGLIDWVAANWATVKKARERFDSK